MAYRILSLDGGGSWSLIQIMTLIDLYRSGGYLLTGHQVLREFDLVVASSSGSLVLGGLLKDLPLPEIQKYFEERGLRQFLFPPKYGRHNPLPRLLRGMTGIGARYTTGRKLQGLRRLLNNERGEADLGDVTIEALRARLRLKTRFLVTAFDYDQQRPICFRSDPQSAAADFSTPPSATLAEAIHAATTAPLDYFDAPAVISRRRRCWDGTIGGASNPVLVGIAEALANGVPADEIEILSIGTGTVLLPLARGNEDPETAKLLQSRRGSDRRRDLRQLTHRMLDDPPDTASFTAHLLLGQRVPRAPDESVRETKLVRMNPVLQPIWRAGHWLRPAGLTEAEDGGDEFVRLSQLPVDISAAGDLALVKKFCALWQNDAVVNQPLRANAETLECEIGQRWYSDAKTQWFALQHRQSAANSPDMDTRSANSPAGNTLGTDSPLAGAEALATSTISASFGHTPRMAGGKFP